MLPYPHPHGKLKWAKAPGWTPEELTLVVKCPTLETAKLSNAQLPDSLDWLPLCMYQLIQYRNLTNKIKLVKHENISSGNTLTHRSLSRFSIRSSFL